MTSNSSRTGEAHRRVTHHLGGVSPVIPLGFSLLAVLIAIATKHSSTASFVVTAAILGTLTAGVVLYATAKNHDHGARRRGMIAVTAGLAAMAIIGWSGVSLTGFNHSWSTGSLFVAICVFSAIFGFTYRTVQPPN